MKKALSILAVVMAVLVAMAQNSDNPLHNPLKTSMPYEIEVVNAPFEVPLFTRPVFPDRTVSIRQTGAKENVLSTAAVQKAIDKVSSKGGGTVEVPDGHWLTGRIILKSNVNLHLADNAVLEFSGDIKDYLPAVRSRYEGVDIMGPGAMIYANHAENIAVTGNGKLLSPGYDCELFRNQTGGAKEAELEKVPVEERIYTGENGGKVMMPHFIGPIFCKNVFIEGVTLEHSIFWNIVPIYCDHTVIRGVTVSSFGHGRTDGIDIDSSINSLIEYVSLDCGDDCFTLKAGRGEEAVALAAPTENVIIRHCLVKRGVGGLTIGSETAGMVRNVYAQDLTMQYPSNPFYFKTRRPRGGGAENIFFEDVKIHTCKSAAIQIDMLGSKTYVGELANRLPELQITATTPMFRNIHIKNINIEDCKMLVRAKGLPERPIENFVLEQVSTPSWAMSLQDVGTITLLP